MKSVGRQTFFLILTFSLNATAADFYRVKPGDTLSVVLLRKGFRPVYGKHGSLNKAIHLNKKLQRHRGARIFPGQRLILPSNVIDQERRVAPSLVSIDDSVVANLETRAPSSYYPRQRRRFLLGLTKGFFRHDVIVNSTKEELELLSDNFWGVRAGATSTWGARISSEWLIGYKEFSLREFKDHRRIQDKSGHLVSASYNLKALMTPSFKIGGGVDLREELFYRLSNAGSLVTEKEPMLVPGVSIGWGVGRLGHRALELSASFSQMFSFSDSSYRPGVGSTIGTSIRLGRSTRSRFSSIDSVTLGFEKSHQSSSFARQESRTLLFGLTFGME